MVRPAPAGAGRTDRAFTRPQGVYAPVSGSVSQGTRVTGKPITDQQARLYMDLIVIHEKQTAAAKAGFSVATGRRLHADPRLPSQKQKPRNWRTRADPLAAVWDSEIAPLLEQAPGLKAVTLLHELERIYPGRFGVNIRRTLERRVTHWKRFHGPEKEVMFPQTVAPGDVGQSDFTHCDDLGVTVAGAALPHLLYHFALPFSGFEHGGPIASGESFVALAEGLIEALSLLGGAPKTHRTDSLSAAFRNLAADAAADQTRRYQDLCAHYRMVPTRNNRGIAHENGSIESRNGHAKRRLDQALLLRGSRDFDDLGAYRAFVAAMFAAHNGRRRAAIEHECGFLTPLPAAPAASWTSAAARVTCHGGFTHGRAFYTAPSRLIGARLRLRVYADELVGYLGGVEVVRHARWRHEGRGHGIDYRHVLASLKVKPGALPGLRYRDALWPRPAYRRAYDALIAALPQKAACRAAIALLALAHEEACEADLAAALEVILDAGELPDPDVLRQRFARRDGEAPSVVVTLPASAIYDALLSGADWMERAA